MKSSVCSGNGCVLNWIWKTTMTIFWQVADIVSLSKKQHELNKTAANPEKCNEKCPVDFVSTQQNEATDTYINVEESLSISSLDSELILDDESIYENSSHYFDNIFQNVNNSESSNSVGLSACNSSGRSETFLQTSEIQLFKLSLVAWIFKK